MSYTPHDFVRAGCTFYDDMQQNGSAPQAQSRFGYSSSSSSSGGLMTTLKRVMRKSSI